jgi:hypothetical protein
VKFSVRTVLALALSIAGFSNLSCKVNDYCLACERGDGGPGDTMGMGDADDGGTMMDGSGSGSACSPDGPEICDGKDNDCNGLVDDGTLPQVGDDCQNQMGECMGGKLQCVPHYHCSVTTALSCFGTTDSISCPNTETCVAEGIETDHLGCTKNPAFETCDGLDNNCNGVADEGDPGGGTHCGTDVGECVAGINHCIGGHIQCQGQIDHTGDPEICDGKDNNCNGMFDEGLTNMGSCGTSGTAPCSLGTTQCIGGAPQCVGAVDPGFEACNGVDDDCNGVIDDGYNKTSDPNNCGPSCMQCTVPPSFNAVPACTAGACGYTCKPGYKDLDGSTANGCEFGPCFPTGPEVCDGKDNNCNGQIDENVTITNFCLTKGECAGTTPTCTGMSGWVCDYGSTVEVTSGGQVVSQETTCDSLDNDCDDAIDEGTPNLHAECHDSGLGVCQKTGELQCDTGNPTGPAVCEYTDNGQPQLDHEVCDDKDNDCDGVVDEDLDAANAEGEEWINIGGGHRMAKYEMSKPDAKDTDAGSVTAHACSRQGVQPWVSVTYPQALAACQSIGATLCTETEWHRACSVINSNAYEPNGLSVVTNGTLIEAEDYSSIATAVDATAETSCTNSSDDDNDGYINDGCPIRNTNAETACNDAIDNDGDGRVNDGCPAMGVTRAWVEDMTPGFSGISDLAAIVNSGVHVAIGSAQAQSPRVDYKINFPNSGNWHVYVKMFSATGNDDTIYMAVNTGAAGSVTPNLTLITSVNGSWVWQDSGTINIPSAGTRTVSLFMGDDGVRVDQIWISQSGSPPSTIATKGATWSYATNATTYQATTCNGQDYDTTQDATIPTGTAASCYANDSLLAGGTANDHAFDMSGNVKEWTLAEQAGHNPIRGGAANNTGNGIACALNFTLADDTFFLSNVGFRCCK